MYLNSWHQTYSDKNLHLLVEVHVGQNKVKYCLGFDTWRTKMGVDIK